MAAAARGVLFVMGRVLPANTDRDVAVGIANWGEGWRPDRCGHLAFNG